MKKILMTFADVLCCAMTMPVLTSCTIEDNPAPRVDYGEWNLLETDMNTSVRPGNDFFMYCNGGYWNSTELDENTYGMKMPLFQGSDDIIKNIVYYGSRDNVVLTMIDGQILYENGVYNIKESVEDIYQKAEEISRRLANK